MGQSRAWLWGAQIVFFGFEWAQTESCSKASRPRVSNCSPQGNTAGVTFSGLFWKTRGNSLSRVTLWCQSSSQTLEFSREFSASKTGGEGQVHLGAFILADTFSVSDLWVFSPEMPRGQRSRSGNWQGGFPVGSGSFLQLCTPPSCSLALQGRRKTPAEWSQH